jgi:hypothetical protein
VVGEGCESGGESGRLLQKRHIQGKTKRVLRKIDAPQGNNEECRKINTLTPDVYNMETYKALKGKFDAHRTRRKVAHAGKSKLQAHNHPSIPPRFARFLYATKDLIVLYTAVVTKSGYRTRKHTNL